MFILQTFNSCSSDYQSTYLDSHEFLLLSLHIVAIFSFPLCIFSGWVIVFKTPPSMSSVKFSLLTFHFWTCFVDIVFSILVCPFLVAPLYAGCTLGLLQYFEINTEYQVMFIMATVEAMCVSILCLYENRFFILSRNLYWWKYARIPWYTMNYTIAVLMFLPVFYQIPDQTHAREFILEHLPCLSSEILSLPLFVVAENAGLMLITSMMELGFLCAQGAFLMFLLNRSIKKFGNHLSQRTLEMQNRFMKAIILQLLIPSFCLNTPFFYIGFSGAFGYFNQKLTNVSFILIATHGFFSSLFMLFVHASYREAVLECFVKIGRILGFNIITVYPERKSTIYPTRHPMLL
ncbi:Serpentine Receptor, class H [Caenorhabditis elegans]|uniref:Serpentine Receptor, class H n=1 Tax=Caenorhabditis elegans TaxID=6239 RepID=O17572_CAEEL|nr:Serpentine Receptor, class H [Caenorhabditis elegans]CAB03849.2 Serpentine Receptor, class H [Caenorhabditis elegans]|eukprot:NP_506858.2 Serpentine Receptor, class H [Caenorhabditis elegans]